MKAEELKQKAKMHPDKVRELTGTTANLYVFGEHELQLYADEVSRERAGEFSKLFDEWLKTQQR